jgi:hypothetical protein
MTISIYKSRPIKRKRRTKAEMEALKGGLYAILHDDHPQTMRGVFYQATVRGLIDKTEPGYKVVQRCLADMRRSSMLPFDYIADSTRWMRKPTTHSDVEAVLFDAWRYYRKAIWNSQADYVEVWMEKDALAGVIYEVTGRGNIREAIELIKELLLDDDVSLTSAKVLDPVGRVLLHGTTSKDMKTRVDSSKLLFTWLGKRTDAEEREKNDSGVSSEDLNNFASLLSIKQELDLMEAEGITSLLCFECKKKLGITDADERND